MVTGTRSKQPHKNSSGVLSLNRLLAKQKSILKKETSPGERLLRILLLGTAGIIVLTGLAFILF